MLEVAAMANEDISEVIIVANKFTEHPDMHNAAFSGAGALATVSAEGIVMCWL